MVSWTPVAGYTVSVEHQTNRSGVHTSMERDNPTRKRGI